MFAEGFEKELARVDPEEADEVEVVESNDDERPTP
jgi:hypothetical protein